jgi:tripartite-type tricarboxylate transporter receptor subunit TctC
VGHSSKVNEEDKMRGLKKILCYSTLGAALISAGPAAAADFTGKNINLIIGFGAGGGYDTNGRLFAQFFGSHLPGKPGIIVQNMPGAGALRAANYIYNVAPKDGTEIAMFASSNALEPLYGNSAAKFETAKFTWIGNLNKEVTSCVVWRNSGINSLDDLKTRVGRFGGSGPTAITSQHPLVLKNLLNLKIEVVQGYKGTKDISLAMERGEVDGTCAMFVSNLEGPYSEALRRGDLKILVQKGRTNHPIFAGAPNLYSLLKNPEDVQIADFIFKQTEIARPIAAPPSLPLELASALRVGFEATMKDAAFIAAAKKMGLGVDAMSAEELQQAFEMFASTPKHIIDRARAVMSP